MKFSTVAFGATMASSAVAFPGMSGDAAAMDFHKSLVRKAHTKRQGPGAVAPFPPGLIAAKNGTATKQIKDCLNGAISCELTSAKTYVAPSLGSSECEKDKCCVWDYVVKDLIALFTESNGQCNKLARQAIRFGFHDAGAWNVDSSFGGADGSLLISDEINRPENKGMEDIFASLTTIKAKYKVGAADLAQMASNLGTVVCPLGPRVFTYVGRKDSSESPEDLLPGAFSNADTLIALFNDKTINPGDLAALVGAHSTSESLFVDPSRPGAFQDSTPGVWDVAFYSETLDANADPTILKFPSDVNLAKDSRSSPAFVAFANPSTGQADWNAAYARAYVRLSILGVNNIDDLVDCTKVLPSPKTGPPPSGGGSSPSPSGSAKASSAAGPSASGKSNNGTASKTVSGDYGYPTDFVHGHIGGDNIYTTTVTKYFTKNGWHIPLETTTCNIDNLPSWAKATAASDPYSSWLATPTAVGKWSYTPGSGSGAGAGAGSGSGSWAQETSKPSFIADSFKEGSCIVKTVTVTATAWA